MKRAIGFSTGSLAPGEIGRAVEMVLPFQTPAIELSALRSSELDEAITMARRFDWSAFRYVSFHAPSRFDGLSEKEVLERLQPIAAKGWPIIVHPDVIDRWDRWQTLGSLVTIENMDGRKPGGRTVDELEPIFTRLPEARFCFDIGHARQIDPTMKLAEELATAFASRLVEVHLSVVDDAFAHQQLTAESMEVFGPVLRGLPESVAIILETPVDVGSMGEQLRLADSSHHTPS